MQLGAGVAGGVAQNTLQVPLLEAGDLGHGLGDGLVKLLVELLHKEVHGPLDGLQAPGAEILGAGGQAVVIGEDQIGHQVANVVAHGGVGGKLRVKDLGGIALDEDGAGVQVAVHQGLGVSHKLEFQLGDLQVEGGILIQLLFHKLLVGGENVVVAVDVVVGFHEHQVLGNLAQLRGDKALYQVLLLLVVHGHVAGHQQGVHHEGGDVRGKIGEGLVLHQGVAHELVVGQILHAAGAHDGVIEIDLGHHAGGILVVELENLRLDAVAVGGHLHILGDTQGDAGVLDDHRVALVVPDAEHVVQIAVANLLGLHGGLVPVDVRQLLQGVL